MFDVETNDRVNITYNSMQMPKVENKTIVIDDYSMCPCIISRLIKSCVTARVHHNSHINNVLSAAALTMEILKPAGFKDTAHYPLLLLV